jgi:uncharacterized protein YPO0396
MSIMTIIVKINDRLQELATKRDSLLAVSEELVSLKESLRGGHEPGHNEAIDTRVQQITIESNKLGARIEELEWVRAELQSKAVAEARTPRSDNQSTILELLAQTPNGLTVRECVDEAREKFGVKLNFNSTGSTLSRLKSEGKVVHEWRRYRLSEFAESYLDAGNTARP